ncbi:hypothetical protein BHE74_00045872, partial [Ensete ventricosum]
DKGTREVSSLKIEATAMDLVGEKTDRFLVENHVGNITEIQETGEREALLSQRDDSAHNKSEGGICTTPTRSEGDEKADIVLTAGSMGKYEKLETQDEDKLTDSKIENFNVRRCWKAKEYLYHTFLQQDIIPSRSPDDSEVPMGLSLIPSSAPSCLADRGNPFDYLYDLADEHSSHIDENWEQEFYVRSKL